MAGPKIKFRCYQCNQLLGVARSRVGKVVACPKTVGVVLVVKPTIAPALLTVCDTADDVLVVKLLSPL